jgi:hypothetical protein
MSPARVWMVQCLCPQRHCILATAEVYTSAQAAEAALLPVLRTMIDGAIASSIINAWCGLCGSTSDTWTYEVGRTAYSTMAEAMPPLQANERQFPVGRSPIKRLHRLQSTRYTWDRPLDTRPCGRHGLGSALYLHACRLGLTVYAPG